MDISYILNELGEERDEYFNSIAPPIIQTSNFAFKSTEDLRNAFSDPYHHMFYSRAGNPTVDILRKKLAALDGAEDALVFGTGIAAITTPILSLLKQGDHIVSVTRPYTWARNFFDFLLPNFGISVTYVDGTILENFEEGMQVNTKLIYLESPNSFSFELQDLQAVCNLAKSKGLLTMLDNSYCTPLLQKPSDFGIDIAVQSATKYLGGHSDVLAGVVTGTASLIKKIYEKELMILGTVISPFSAWLVLRGLRTLPIRLEKICRSTRQVVDFLIQHDAIEKVIFPFDTSFKQFELAKRQMRDAGGLFSIVLKAKSFENIELFCNSLKRFKMTVSWGGHESLVIPATVALTKDSYNENEENHRLIRFYIGLEEPEYLIEELKEILDKMFC